MREGSFAMDGLEFGAGTQIRVRELDTGDRVVRDQDAARPGGNGMLMGRDFEEGPEWYFDLIIKGGGGAATFDLVEAVRGAWSVQHAPGQASVLRFALPGRQRRVYGRPRRFAADGAAIKHGWHADHYPVLATFQLADPLIYDDTPESLTLTLTTAPGGGLRFPASFPWRFRSAPGRRDGEVSVGGHADVPFELTFYGPSTGSASGYWAAGAGWRVELAATLAWDQWARVDTRSNTVTRSDGRSLAGDARGRFLTARLSPGPSEVSWGCDDPSATASMTLTHRPGYWSL